MNCLLLKIFNIEAVRERRTYFIEALTYDDTLYIYPEMVRFS